MFSQGRTPIITGFESTPEKLSASYCLECHRETHGEWERGMHARAWSNAVFQEAFAQERREWCVNCHAPLAAQNAAWHAEGSRAAILHEGINCVACHVREGHILTRREGACDGGPVRIHADFGEADFCAGCHQFNFPVAFQPIRYSDAPMQNTYAEWRDSGSKYEGYQCHYAGHERGGSTNSARMSDTFYDFSVERLSPAVAHIAFHAVERGHLLPTGDLYRSVAVEAAYDPDFVEIYYRRRWARFFTSGQRGQDAPAGMHWNRRLSRNSGLRPETKLISLTIDAPRSPVYVRLVRNLHDQDLGGLSRLRKSERMTVLWSTAIY